MKTTEQPSSTIPDITPEWLYRRLGRDFFAPAGIREINCTNIGEGQGFAGIVLRLGLVYDDATDAPSSMIVKLPSPDPEVRALMSQRDMLFREPRFYRDVIPSLTVRTPRSLHVHIDEPAEDYALVLEDLGDIANEPDRFATVEEVIRLLQAIAPLHAQFWNDPLALEPWLLPVTDNAPDRAADVARISKGVSVIEEFLGESYLLECAREIERQFPKAPTKFPIVRPFTIIHGDFHGNNVAEVNGETYIYDWQVVSRGTPDADVTNLMLSSLSTDDFIAYQEQCYEEYHKALIAAGVSGYPYKKFRKSCTQAMMLNVLKFVVILGTIDFNVPNGQQLRNRVLNTLSAVAEQSDALKFFRRLPMLFMMMKVINLFSR
jgi:hypothetical protein